MGQYFKGVILLSKNNKVSNRKKIAVSLSPHDYHNFSKMMEHSYIGNKFVSAFLTLIKEDTGAYAGLPVVWAGDYADDEPRTFNNNFVNLYDLADELKTDAIGVKPTNCRYIINRDKKLYVDCSKMEESKYGLRVHPLPLLCCDSVDRGGGDYHKGRPDFNLVGTWCRNIVVSSDSCPTDGYKELVVKFKDMD